MGRRLKLIKVDDISPSGAANIGFLLKEQADKVVSVLPVNPVHELVQEVVQLYNLASDAFGIAEGQSAGRGRRARYRELQIECMGAAHKLEKR